LNTIGRSGHVTSTIPYAERIGWGLRVWLGFGIRAYGQGLGSSFWFSGLMFRVRVEPAVHLCKQEAANCLPALKP